MGCLPRLSGCLHLRVSAEGECGVPADQRALLAALAGCAEGSPAETQAAEATGAAVSALVQSTTARLRSGWEGRTHTAATWFICTSLLRPGKRLLSPNPTGVRPHLLTCLLCPLLLFANYVQPDGRPGRGAGWPAAGLPSCDRCGLQPRWGGQHV